MENNEQNRPETPSVGVPRLKEFLTYCHSSAPVRRDRCGDSYIEAWNGHIYCDGTGFLVFLSFTDHPRSWTFAKKRLIPFKVTQDGNDEGCIHIDAGILTCVPANILRSVIGLRKRRPPPKHLEKWRFGNA